MERIGLKTWDECTSPNFYVLYPFALLFPCVVTSSLRVVWCCAQNDIWLLSPSPDTSLKQSLAGHVDQNSSCGWIRAMDHCHGFHNSLWQQLWKHVIGSTPFQRLHTHQQKGCPRTYFLNTHRETVSTSIRGDMGIIMEGDIGKAAKPRILKFRIKWLGVLLHTGPDKSWYSTSRQGLCSQSDWPLTVALLPGLCLGSTWLPELAQGGVTVLNS